MEKEDVVKADAVKEDATKEDAAKADAVKEDAVKEDVVKADAVKESSVKEDAAEEYILKNKDLTVRFTKKGGSLTSIKDADEIEYLWQGDAAYWSGQAPVLFPICGSLRGDQARIGGDKITRMPRHGIVRKRDFICREKTENSILFSIGSNAEMEAQFPYPFRLDIRYLLDGRRVITEYAVTNRGNELMPFQIGGHPGFNCPLFPEEKYEDYQLVFPGKESCSVPMPITETGLIDMAQRTEFLRQQDRLNLSHALFEKDAVILDELCARQVTLCGKRHGKGVRLDFQDFPYLILWSSANHGPFIALEPWIGLSTCSDEGDVFEEKRNIQFAEPGEEKKYSFMIDIL